MKKIILFILCITLTLTMLALPAQADTCTVKTSGGTLNLREDPSTGSASIAKIPNGETIPIIEAVSNKEGNWFKVNYNGTIGYVYGKYAVRNSDGILKTGEITASSLNMRSSCNTSSDSNIICSIKKGAKVTILSSTTVSGSEWYYINYNDRNGYVSAKYVKVTEETVTDDPVPQKDPVVPVFPEPPAAPLKQETVTVIEKLPSPLDYQQISAQVICTVTASSGTALRKAASASSEQLKAIPKGKEMVSISETRDANDLCWYKVEYDGILGYISYNDISVRIGTLSTAVKEGDLIDTPVEKPVSDADTFTSCYGIISGGYNGRKGPGTNYSTVIFIEKDTLVTLTAREKASNGVYWYQYSMNGKTAWTSKAGIMLLDTSGNDTAPASVGVVYVSASTVSMVNKPGDSTGIGSVPKNTALVVTEDKTVNGKHWYKATYGGKTGYVDGTKTVIVSGLGKTVSADSEFEKKLSDQGFPESYKPALRLLHAKYPNWEFKADKISNSWSICVARQYVFGDSLPGSWSGTKAVSIVDKNKFDTWKSKDPGAYDASTGQWITNWDGDAWAIASKALVKYSMDPRPFLSEAGIFQFLDLRYSGGISENDITSFASQINAGWLGKNYTHTTDNTTVNYPKVLLNAGTESGMNPLAIMCIITQELGVEKDAVSRKQIAGNVSGYAGYYNYFNVGAYADGSLSAWERGLSEAKTKYDWNTREKAITGGAQNFEEKYLSKAQETFYYMKFNVKNDFNHEFSTEIQWANSLGKNLMKVYTSAEKSDMALTFRIPVYTGMPDNPCPAP